MLSCPNPTCKKRLPRLTRQCPHCRTDLDLLVTYVEDLGDGLVRAEELTKAGKLGEAVWAYLEVLEVDPDNVSAKKQVGQVVTAVRQFDETAPGRRWWNRLRRQARFRQKLYFWENEGEVPSWFGAAAGFFLAMVIFLWMGYWWGYYDAQPTPETPAATKDESKDQSKDKDQKEKPKFKLRLDKGLGDRPLGGK